MSEDNTHPRGGPSSDGSTTTRAPSERSTPSMINQEANDNDMEKGRSTADPIDSKATQVQDESLPEKTQIGTGPPALTATPSPGPPPDGGAEAWMSVLGAFCGLFVSFGWINCIGIFQTYYETHQLRNLSTSTVTWITSLETFVMFFVGPIFGTLFDNYGPRAILLGGTFFHVFGLMMASLSTEYYQFILAQGICSPLGASAIFNASVNSVSTWFAKRRAFALGITASGSSLGGVIFPIMVSNLIPKPFDIMNFVRPLKDVKFVVTVAACFCFFWGMFLPFTFVITQAQRYGMSEHLSLYLIPILNAASIFGRTLPGYLADRIGRYNIMIFFSYLSAILVLALWLPSRSNVPAIIFSALYGFSSGAFVSIVPALIAQISDLREVGVRNGTCFSIISFAALTGTPIGGALVPDVLTGSYTKLQVFCGVVMMAGSTLFVVARIVVGGWKLGKV
ncbi:Fujikurins efflux protein [Penicillium oxalicum]|uniref:Fujikurins efflux protein n=1 Tax=Penicillium oxalicum TaxID=69781 RepID=UPI00215207F2|nr:Fujikurins efflux protein [Penicillium oxalicum]KAI2785613.1 Fujikurins efflux protein [Penicillium oxalicum]